jgi:RNA polymerase sigma-70 factor (ECF subfamily)
MVANDESERLGPQAAWDFATTRWSLVAAAGEARSPESQEALATLCQVYWYPLYAYARRRLATIKDAQDLTQHHADGGI